MSVIDDAGLIAACEAARAATEAYQRAAEQDEPGEVMSALLDRELAMISCVTATRAKTTVGLAAKAMALDHFLQANTGSIPSPEARDLLFAIVEDAIGIVKCWVAPGA